MNCPWSISSPILLQAILLDHDAPTHKVIGDNSVYLTIKRGQLLPAHRTKVQAPSGGVVPARAVPATIDIQLRIDAEAAREASSSSRHRRHVAAPSWHSRVKSFDGCEALRLISAAA